MIVSLSVDQLCFAFICHWFSQKRSKAKLSIDSMAPKTKTTKAAPVPKHPILCKTSSGALDHLALSESLGYHIFRKKQRRSWTPAEDKMLKNMVIQAFLDKNNLEKYNKEDINISEIDWAKISGKFEGRKSKECRKRWSSSLNPRLRKGKWTKEEDAQLIKAYKQYGSSWQKVAMMINGRNEDQCSKRYTEVLNTDPKERLKPWTKDEDIMLIHGVKKRGTKWRAISKSLKGRPSLTCRNRWRRIITDVAKGSASEDIMKAVGVFDKNGNRLYTFEASKDRKGKKLEAHSSVKAEPVAGTAVPAASLVSSPQFQQAATKQGNNANIAQSYSPSVSSSYASGSSPSSSTSSGSAGSMNILGHHTCPPTRSCTQWRYALLDPRTNEELPQFSGQITTASLAHKLIELAKYNGVALTVHQHIHHHYSPASPVPDPQASVSRFSHFNYLPPLTEVPKLTSSSHGSVKESSTSPQAQPDKLVASDKQPISPPGGAVPDALMQYQMRANGNAGSPSLIPMFTGRDKRSMVTGQRRPDAFVRSHSSENNSANISQARDGVQRSNSEGNSMPRRQQLVKDSSEIRQNENGKHTNNDSVCNDKGAQINTNNTNSDDLEEEGLDFWETLRSITQPKQQSGGRPVSQHHPVHYLEAAETETYSSHKSSSNDGQRNLKPTSTGGKQDGSLQVAANNKFQRLSKNDTEEEEEEMENYTNQYGLYYNVFPNKSHSGNKRSPHADSEFGYVMPFNPS